MWCDESELVSGFNTEYIRGRFSLIFPDENVIIIFISNLYVIFSRIDDLNNTLIYYIKLLLIKY